MNRNVGTFRLENLTCNVEEVELLKSQLLSAAILLKGLNLDEGSVNFNWYFLFIGPTIRCVVVLN